MQIISRQYISALKANSILSSPFLDYQPRKPPTKRDDLLITTIVRDVTPVRAEEPQTLSTVPPVMDTIVQHTVVAPARVELPPSDADVSPTQPTLTATEQLAEQTAQILDDIRKSP